MTVTFESLTVPPPEETSADWNDQGVVRLPGLIPDELIVRYSDCWRRENANRHGLGWAHATPYMEHEEIRDLLLYRPLVSVIAELIGEEPGLHLNLTNWVSTERNWHSDQYLNEPGVDDRYAAVWVALGNITSDSGPFQYVPGSHRWPQVNREKLLSALGTSTSNTDWPRDSESILTPLFDEEIAKRDADVVTYLPHKGDVLIWHARLLHRGSLPLVPGRERRSLIAHYSGLSRQKIDMPQVRQHAHQGWYFVLQGGPA